MISFQVPAKENNGKAAHRQLLRRIVFVACGTIVVAASVFAIEQIYSNKFTLGSQSEVHRTLRESETTTAKSTLRKKIVTADNDEQLLDLIAKGHLHLINIQMTPDFDDSDGDGTYYGIQAEFCPLGWAAHKRDPSATPMFRDLLLASGDACSSKSIFALDLSQVVQHVRQYDAQKTFFSSSKSVHQLKLGAVIFHESRCGSTLLANLLQAWDPEAHRVYSESGPPLSALHLCGDNQELCRHPDITPEHVLRDVIYLMSRSNDANEKRVFFKIQSIGTRQLSVWQRAFSEIPWFFVYRNPVEVLESQLHDGPRLANCAMNQRNKEQTPIMLELADQADKDIFEMSPTEYCAMHLASLTNTAVRLLNDKAIPLEYNNNLALQFSQIASQKIRNMPPLTRQVQSRLDAMAQKYSKGSNGRARNFKQDSDEKQAMATHEIEQASKEFLEHSYAALKSETKKALASFVDSSSFNRVVSI